MSGMKRDVEQGGRYATQCNAFLKVTSILRVRVGHAFRMDFTATLANPDNQELETSPI